MRRSFLFNQRTENDMLAESSFLFNGMPGEESDILLAPDLGRCYCGCSVAANLCASIGQGQVYLSRAVVQWATMDESVVFGDEMRQTCQNDDVTLPSSHPRPGKVSGLPV